MLDLVKILKDCPNGTKLYCPIFGEVIFVKVLNDGSDYKIKTTTSRTEIEVTFTADGRYYESEPDAECVLFPSKDCRDWSKFKCPQKTEFEKDICVCLEIVRHPDTKKVHSSDVGRIYHTMTLAVLN